MPGSSTNPGPIDDLGSAATSGGDPRSKIIKLAGGISCELPVPCLPRTGGTSLPIPGCPAPSRKGNPALRNPASADAPEQPVLEVPNQPDSHRPRRTGGSMRALAPTSASYRCHPSGSPRPAAGPGRTVPPGTAQVRSSVRAVASGDAWAGHAGQCPVTSPVSPARGEPRRRVLGLQWSYGGDLRFWGRQSGRSGRGRAVRVPELS